MEMARHGQGSHCTEIGGGSAVGRSSVSARRRLPRRHGRRPDERDVRGQGVSHGVPPGGDRSPSIGVGTNSLLGTQFSGGASVFFSDMLGNQMIGVAVQASGQLRDIGGQFLYLNSARRWNWG